MAARSDKTNMSYTAAPKSELIFANAENNNQSSKASVENRWRRRPDQPNENGIDESKPSNGSDRLRKDGAHVSPSSATGAKDAMQGLRRNRSSDKIGGGRNDYAEPAQPRSNDMTTSARDAPSTRFSPSAQTDSTRDSRRSRPSSGGDRLQRAGEATSVVSSSLPSLREKRGHTTLYCERDFQTKEQSEVREVGKRKLR